jgi:acetolactate synthase-1/3 small subunit
MGVAQKSVTFELSGDTASIDDFISMVKPFGIKEIVRSGAVAIAQGKN